MAVIIRCHNHGTFLDDALQSVYSQSRSVDEIIVVNDGSTDDTAEVLAAHQRRHNRVRSVHHPTALGPARSFNAGAGASTSSLLLPLDADDRLSALFVERTTAALLRSGADIACTGACVFGSEERWLPARFDVNELRVENELLVSCLFRRWIFDCTGGFAAELDGVGYEDWDFWLSACELGARVVRVSGCWLDYRRHPTGSRNSMSRVTSLRAHLMIYRRHPTVRVRHLARWSARSLRRTIARLTR